MRLEYGREKCSPVATARRGSAFRQSREQEALAFVVDAAHLHSLVISMAQQAALVDKARGELGSNLEYVEQTAAKLQRRVSESRVGGTLVLIRAKRTTLRRDLLESTHHRHAKAIAVVVDFRLFLK